MASTCRMASGVTILIFLCSQLHTLMGSAIVQPPTVASLTAEQGLENKTMQGAEINSNLTDGVGEKQLWGGCNRAPCQTHEQCCANYYCSFQVMIFGRTGFCASYADVHALDFKVGAGAPLEKN